jgi:hypothetical protein
LLVLYFNNGSSDKNIFLGQIPIIKIYHVNVNK